MAVFLKLSVLAALLSLVLSATLERAEELYNDEKRGNDDMPAPQETHGSARALPVPDTHKEKRGRAKKAVSAEAEATIFNQDGSTYMKSVEDMCIFSHNYIRQKHNIPDLKWNAGLAKGCEDYAKTLVKTGKLVHSTGDYGENLYVASNTYNGVSTASHAVYAWNSEEWDPNPEDGVIKMYNYNFNPSTSNEFHAAGTGHFSALIWKDTTDVGCGVASTTYNADGYTWTRTVVCARYSPTGNMLNTFTDEVKPLKNGDKSLKGDIRVGNLIPGTTACKDFLPPGNCDSFKNSGFCMVVEHDCNCECAPTK